MLACKKDYCYYEKKLKKKKNRKNFFIFLFSVCLVLFLLIYFFSKIVNPIILSYGEIESKRLVSMSCNEAISDIAVSIAYDQLITVSYNEDNTISMIKANTEQINKISNVLAQKTQNLIDKNGKIGFKIPIGNFTGIGFLTNKGSKVSFYIIPVGSVLCYFYTSFTSAGINQTCHKIFVTIETNCSLILPFVTKKFATKADYLLTECIIVGKVPTTYLNLTKLEDIS